MALQGLLFVFQSTAQDYPGLAIKGENLSKKIEKYFFIAVDIDKSSAFTGECIVATYKLYVALDIQGKVTKAPSYSGFASYDIQNNAETYGVEEIRGIPFKVYTIKKVQLFALRPGLQRLEPVELEAVVRFQKAETRGRYAESYARGEVDTLVPCTLKSQPIQIEVLPLPEDKPESFVGAVGQFQISSLSSSAKLAPGETGYLELTILGSGNWHDVILPKINWPDGLEVFEPKLKETIRKEAVPLFIERTLRFPFTTKKTGSYKIPPLTFSFFNPAKSEYETAETLPVTWQVSGTPIKATVKSSDNEPADYTALFTKGMLVLIPVVGIILLLLLFQRKKEQRPVSENLAERGSTLSTNGEDPASEKSTNRPAEFLNSPKKVIEKLRVDMEVWKKNHPQLFSGEVSSDEKVNFEVLYTKTEQLMYGPMPAKQDAEQLEASWKLFKKQNQS